VGPPRCLPLLATTLATLLTTTVTALAAALTAAVAAARLVSAAAAAALRRSPRAAALAAAAVATVAATVASSLSTAVTSTVSAATASVAAAARSTTASAVGGLVDANPTSVEFLVVHGLHSGIGLGVLGIANKAKASAAASIAVLNHDGFFDLTELLELLTESLVVGVPCEASNEELRHGESDVWVEH